MGLVGKRGRVQIASSNSLWRTPGSGFREHPRRRTGRGLKQDVQLPAAACWLSAARKALVTSLVPALREAELSIHRWGPPPPTAGCLSEALYGTPGPRTPELFAPYDVELLLASGFTTMKWVKKVVETGPSEDGRHPPNEFTL